MILSGWLPGAQLRREAPSAGTRRHRPSRRFSSLLPASLKLRAFQAARFSTVVKAFAEFLFLPPRILCRWQEQQEITRGCASGGPRVVHIAGCRAGPVQYDGSLQQAESAKQKGRVVIATDVGARAKVGDNAVDKGHCHACFFIGKQPIQWLVLDHS